MIKTEIDKDIANPYKCIIEKAFTRLIELRDKEITKAINHVFKNENWNKSEIKNRGLITINPDKSETFSFDGKDLIIFYPWEWKEDKDGFGAFLHVEHKFKRLYE